MTTKKPLISVVVPIYKAERWLRECVDSILAQTLPDIEVLLVDDGSPDGCGAICDEYAAKDTRVRAIHKENGGISMARKTGVDNATAYWIAFVDDDDTLPVTALSDLYRGGGNLKAILSSVAAMIRGMIRTASRQRRTARMLSRGDTYVVCHGHD